jgi:hypothetical protein
MFPAGATGESTGDHNRVGQTAICGRFPYTSPRRAKARREPIVRARAPRRPKWECPIYGQDLGESQDRQDRGRRRSDMVDDQQFGARPERSRNDIDDLIVATEVGREAGGDHRCTAPGGRGPHGLQNRTIGVRRRDDLVAGVEPQGRQYAVDGGSRVFAENPVFAAAAKAACDGPAACRNRSGNSNVKKLVASRSIRARQRSCSAATDRGNAPKDP